MCFVDNVSRNGWIGFSLFFFVFDSRVMKVVWLVLLVVLVGGVCCEEGVYEGIGGDVMMVLEIAQEVAEERKHSETTPVHVLFSLVRNSRIHHSLPKEDSIDLEDFLISSLRKIPVRQEEEEEEEGVSYSLPPLSTESLTVLSAMKAIATEDNFPSASPFHLYEALFESEFIAKPITEQFFDTTVVEDSLLLMENARMARAERSAEDCGAEEEGEEAEKKQEKKEKKEKRKRERTPPSAPQTPEWLQEKIGDGSGWGMFLNVTYEQTLSDRVISFGFDVLELIPKDSMIILTGQPLYELFLELPNVVRKEILEVKRANHHLTEENTKDVRGLRGDVHPIYTGYLQDVNFAEKKATLFPKVTFPADRYTPNESKENTYNLLEFLNANFEKLNIFFATDPFEDQEGVWEDLFWLKEYSLVPHGFYHKLIKISDMNEEEWYKPHLKAVEEMTTKIDVKNLYDEMLQKAFWNIIRSLHKKITASIQEEKSSEYREASKHLTKFFRKLLKKPTGYDEFVPLDILYMQCLTFMKWVYPEIGGEALPDPARFKKSRKSIEYIVKRFQAHPEFDNSDLEMRETILSFESYLEVTQKAIDEFNQKLEQSQQKQQ